MVWVSTTRNSRHNLREAAKRSVVFAGLELEASNAAAEMEAQAQLAEAQRLQRSLKDAEALSEAAMGGDTGAIVAEIQQQAAQDKAALYAANADLEDARMELERLQSELELSGTIGAKIPETPVVPKLVGIPSSQPETAPPPPREWRSPNGTMRSPERTPPRLRWTPRGEQAKRMQDQLKAQLKEQRDETEKLQVQLVETEKLIDAAMAGHTDDINNVLHDQLKLSRDQALEQELAAQEERAKAAEAQNRIEAQLTRIADLEANQLVHSDGQTQTSNGDTVIKADDYVRLERAADALMGGVSGMQKQTAEALRDLAVWRATAAGQDPRSAAIPSFEFDSFSGADEAGLLDKLEQMIVPSLTRVPLDDLQRSLADVIRENEERDSQDINSMPWSVLRDYAITQRQRVEALSDENGSLTRRWTDVHNDPATGAAQIAALRSQLACKDAELLAIRGDLARFLQPTSASKDDGAGDKEGDDGFLQKLEARYHKVVQAERALEDRTRRDHTARRKWSTLLQERTALAQQAEKLEGGVRGAEDAHAQAAVRWDASMRSTRLELAHLAAGGRGDPRRQAAELLVAQLHTADRAVSEAQAAYRDESRRASRLDVELTALRQAEGLTAWGDGVAAQREHMAALRCVSPHFSKLPLLFSDHFAHCNRDEIMELRTLLGRGQVRSLQQPL